MIANKHTSGLHGTAKPNLDTKERMYSLAVTHYHKTGPEYMRGVSCIMAASKTFIRT